jgi:type IV secretory pathway VirB2 component (pilin)
MATNWLLWDSSTNKIRTWDFHIDDIPWILVWLIDIFLAIAWTVAVVFVIVWAYKLLFGSLQWDHTKWRETIIMAITGFAISALAWFIVKFLFNNLS